MKITAKHVKDDEIINNNDICLSIKNNQLKDAINRILIIDKSDYFNKQYIFHKNNCKYKNTTPFKNVEIFVKRGKSSNNSTKWQCKFCNKFSISDIYKILTITPKIF